MPGLPRNEQCLSVHNQPDSYKSVKKFSASDDNCTWC